MSIELLMLLGGLALIIKGGDAVPRKSPLKASLHHAIAYIDSPYFTAPNFGFVILESAKVFKDEGISPLGLLLGALLPTAVAVMFFWLLH